MQHYSPINFLENLSGLSSEFITILSYGFIGVFLVTIYAWFCWIFVPQLMTEGTYNKRAMWWVGVTWSHLAVLAFASFIYLI